MKHVVTITAGGHRIKLYPDGGSCWEVYLPGIKTWVVARDSDGPIPAELADAVAATEKVLRRPRNLARAL